MKEIKTHKKYLGEFENIKLLVEDAEVLFDFQKEGEATEDEVEAKYQEAILAFEDLEFHRTLNRPEDELGVILEINAGAGGTEACDWAEMIFRMYVRWAERSGFKVTALSEVQGDVAGIKSAEIEITGDYVYGMLKGENGVHRLVRVSPYNSQGKRMTSFCSVFVHPSVDDTIEIEINPADLDWDTFRASGAGGQHVNKTESAIRITHLPTGIVSESQDGRSQHQNKEIAMQKLYQRILDQQTAAKQSELAAQRRSLVGSGDRSEKIRTYNYPQNRCTDHRINLTLYNLDQIMDGQIDGIIEALQVAENARILEGSENG